MTRLLILSGTALILVASILYASLPPNLVLPVADPSDPATWSSSVAVRLKLAGSIGLIGDAVLIVGAVRAAREQHPLFWGATALATLMFVVFDAITARALEVTPPAVMPLMRELMSLTFLFGLVTFAIGALSAPIWPRLSQTGCAIVLAAACLWFVVPVPPLVFGAGLFAALALIAAAGLQTGLSTRAVT
jgi:hypothetical protein